MRTPSFKRIIVIVLDSVGIGEMPDASEYGDTGSHTLGNIAKEIGGLKVPNMEAMGLGLIQAIDGVRRVESPLASYGKMREVSKGKDTITGHWELMGIISKLPFPLYPSGFPDDIIKVVKEISGRNVIGNIPASGTEIIKNLGSKHTETGDLIVYTSADSVLQVAAHEETVPLRELFHICSGIRSRLIPPHSIARVIARPFLGKDGEYYRTRNRHDYSVKPPTDTVLDILAKNGISVLTIGKINDIFSGRGISSSFPTKSNMDGINKLKHTLSSKDENSFIFINLIDFDMEFGHRNDVKGYANCLHEFDSAVPSVISDMNDDDLLIITADHGCDPTTKSTDHSREYVPLLAYSKHAKKGVPLGVRNSFSDVGATIVENFGLKITTPGTSFLDQLL